MFNSNFKNRLISCLIFCALFGFGLSEAFAQTTEFTYQGRLLDNTLPANANYDFEFRLFDVDSDGVPIATQQRLGVTVSSGIFSVRLDFGAQFGGAGRWLEIAVRPAGGGAFTTLNPRQPITSAPYNIRSLNAMTAETATNSLNLGGIAANQYVLTNDSRLSDERMPLAGSSNYIQNTNAAQTGVNFNIGGDGMVGGTLSGNVVNATTQFNLGGFRILSADSSKFSTFVGFSAGVLSTGFNNSFFGNNAGQATTTGAGNSFFGKDTGLANTTGTSNSFFGAFSGQNNTTGVSNSFFGTFAGRGNTTGINNSFFGIQAGLNNNGGSNSFFGAAAGRDNTTGSGNIFIGTSSGLSNTTENFNTFIGFNANGAAGITNSTAIGANAFVGSSNTIVLGNNANVDIPGGGLYVRSTINVGTLGGGFPGNQTLCYNNFASFNNVLSFCSSSLRYKTDVQNYTEGLDLVRRLRPVSFTWKGNGERDLGFVAEEVAAVEPLMTTLNQQGEIEGVKYDRISAALVNAVNEQQTQIEQQKERINQQQTQIDALKKLVCQLNSQAEICQEKEQ